MGQQPAGGLVAEVTSEEAELLLKFRAQKAQSKQVTYFCPGCSKKRAEPFEPDELCERCIGAKIRCITCGTGSSGEYCPMCIRNGAPSCEYCNKPRVENGVHCLSCLDAIAKSKGDFSLLKNIPGASDSDLAQFATSEPLPVRSPLARPNEPPMNKQVG